MDYEIYFLVLYVPLPQLDRGPGCDPGSRRFEPYMGLHILNLRTNMSNQFNAALKLVNGFCKASPSTPRVKIVNLLLQSEYQTLFHDLRAPEIATILGISSTQYQVLLDTIPKKLKLAAIRGNISLENFKAALTAINQES